MGFNHSTRNALTTQNSEIALIGSRLDVVKGDAAQLYNERQIEIVERMKRHENSINNISSYCKAGVDKALSQEGDWLANTEKAFAQTKKILVNAR